jgi:hypothetical protein
VFLSLHSLKGSYTIRVVMNLTCQAAFPALLDWVKGDHQSASLQVRKKQAHGAIVEQCAILAHGRIISPSIHASLSARGSWKAACFSRRNSVGICFFFLPFFLTEVIPCFYTKHRVWYKNTNTTVWLGLPVYQKAEKDQPT